MNVLLVFPPAFNPTQPYLAPFTVAGILRSLTDWNVDVLDWSVESYRLLLDPTFIHRVAARRGIMPPSLLVQRLECTWHALQQPGEAYQDAVAAIDELFAWYETVFPRVRLFRYCGMEAVEWSLDESCDLLEFAACRDSNIFSALFEEIVQPQLRKREYDSVGVTLVCRDQLVASATLALELRTDGNNARLVLGGPLATMLAARLQGREFLGLFDYVHQGGGPDSHVSAFKPSSTPLPKTTAEWSSPDWSDVDWNAYLAPQPVVPIHATSGCPFNCRFCSSPAVALAMDGVTYRQRPASEVAAEMETHASEGRRYFLLVGEMLTWPHAAAIGRAIAARGLADRVAWYFWTRTTPTPPAAVLGELRAHGCRRICFGLETTDARALLEAGKQTASAEAIETLMRVIGADIQPHLFLMTGLPGQDSPACDEELLRLIDALTAAGAYGVTTTVSAFEPEEWSAWRPLVISGIGRKPALDLRVKAAATDAAELHAARLRTLMQQRLAGQPPLGAFGNVHQLVFLDRVQSARPPVVR
jgi:hypothetical protein